MSTLLQTLQPLDDEARRRVLDWLASRLGLSPSTSSIEVGTIASLPERGTIKEFLKHKSPDDDVSRATALAFYLAHHEGKTTFKTADLTTARIDAGLASFNISRAVSHSQRAGYLTSAGGRGVYHITSTGEALVDAMPDQERIRAVKSQAKGRRRPASARRTTRRAALKKT
jgi:hypothetical protein